jgi:hypothetical protein
MASEEVHRARRSRVDDPPARAEQTVDSRSLRVRNYDGDAAHELCVRFVDASGEVVFRRVVTVAPMETVTVRTRLERAVYRVEARLDGDDADSAECLIGSGLDETALIETGNGTVSVVEGTV